MATALPAAPPHSGSPSPPPHPPPPPKVPAALTPGRRFAASPKVRRSAVPSHVCMSWCAAWAAATSRGQCHRATVILSGLQNLNVCRVVHSCGHSGDELQTYTRKVIVGVLAGAFTSCKATPASTALHSNPWASRSGILSGHPRGKSRRRAGHAAAAGHCRHQQPILRSLAAAAWLVRISTGAQPLPDYKTTGDGTLRLHPCRHSAAGSHAADHPCHHRNGARAGPGCATDIQRCSASHTALSANVRAAQGSRFRH